MPDQRPLLNNTQKENLPNSEEIIGGPEFEPAPGWGHKVNGWLKKYFNKVILPGIAMLILVMGITNYTSDNADRDPFALDEVGITGIVKLDEEESVELVEVIETDSGIAIEIIQSAEPGDGVTHLARKSLKKYLELNPDIQLKDEHKIYIEDYLKDKVGSQPLEIGDTIRFSTDDISTAIDGALSLTDAQVQNLSQYVQLVNF